jgi:hypothetical protein
MAIYINNRKDAVFSSVEFTPTIDGNFSFFHIKDAAGVAEAKQQLAALGESIISETTVNGSPMLITRGKRTDYSTLNALEDAGNKFTVPEPDHSIKPWKLRGWASMIGQPLQLVSSFLTKANGIDAGVAGFASLNMIANIANIAFGAEQSQDTNQLRFLKKKFNYELSQYLPDGSSSKLPSSYDDRMHLRQGKEKPPSFGTKAYDFAKRNSVGFFEIGLRYMGSVMLVFPIDKWRTGFSAFGDSLKKPLTGKPNSLATAVIDGAKAAYNKDSLSAKAGLAYVAGKSLAFTTKVPDPYDTKPHTWVDTVREKVVFPLSSGIEAVAAGIISYNSLFVKKIKYSTVANKTEGLVKRFEKILPQAVKTWNENLKENPGSMRDWFGGIGGALFTSGLIIRMFAKFGHKEVDMNELNAHLVDGLAQVPPEKLPKLVADFSAYLTEHFKGQLEFGQVYKELTDGLYKYHQIALPGIDQSQMHTIAPALAAEKSGAETGQKAPAFARGDMKASAIAKPASYTERVTNRGQDAVLSI